MKQSAAIVKDGRNNCCIVKDVKRSFNGEGPETVNCHSEGRETVNYNSGGPETVNCHSEGRETVNYNSEGPETVNCHSEGRNESTTIVEDAKQCKCIIYFFKN